jgi:hypothetical protein
VREQQQYMRQNLFLGDMIHRLLSSELSGWTSF